MDRALTRDDSPIGFRLALAALAVLLAWATYRWVEKPLRFTRRLPLRQVFTGAAVAAMVLMLAALGLARMHLLPADIQALVERTRSDRPANMARCHYSLDATVARLPGADCHSARGPAPRVAIWGDSHVLAWQPFAWKLARLSQVSEVLVMGPVPDLPMPADQCIAAGRLVDCVTPRLHFERSSARAPAHPFRHRGQIPQRPADRSR